MTNVTADSADSDQRGLMMCRGVRGAITVGSDQEDDILEATRELLQALTAANDMNVDDIASVYFTTSPDLTATYPAKGRRPRSSISTTAKRFLVIEIVAEFGAGFFLAFHQFGGEDAGVEQEAAQFAQQGGIFAELFHQDVFGASAGVHDVVRWRWH